MKKIFFLSLIVTMIGMLFGVTAQEVLTEVADNYENLNDAKATILLTKSDENDMEESKFTVYIYKEDENTRYTIIRFLSPLYKKNITLLSKGPEETYMYMPVLKTVKKMEASSKNEKFADSDFTYEELSLLYKISDFAEKATIYDQNDEKYIIEVDQEDKDIPYSSVRIEISKATMLLGEVTFYNWRDKASKVIDISDYEEIDDKMIPWTITAYDYKTEGKTTLNFKEVELDIGMDSEFFSPKNISRPHLKY